MLIRTALVSAVIERELRRIGRYRHTVVRVSAVLSRILHHIACAALEDLTSAVVIEHDVHIVPCSVNCLDVDIIIACTALCKVAGAVLIVMSDASAVRHINAACLIGRIRQRIGNYLGFVQRSAQCRQTVIEDDLFVVFAVALRYAELVDSVCSTILGKLEVTVRSNLQRIVITCIQIICIGVMIGIGMIICIACCILCSDRRNARPYGVAGSQAVVLAQVAAAVEVSIK